MRDLEYVFIEGRKGWYHAQLVYRGVVIGETMPLRSTRAAATKDGHRVFRRTWNRDKIVTGRA